MRVGALIVDPGLLSLKKRAQPPNLTKDQHFLLKLTLCVRYAKSISVKMWILGLKTSEIVQNQPHLDSLEFGPLRIHAATYIGL